MSSELITYVNTVLVPAGLIAIMFSLGLSLSLADFTRVLQQPKAVAIGLLGQLIVLPLLGATLTIVFFLPPEMAIGIIILAACPGGVTSNALIFALRGDVALSVTLTAFSSLITVFTTPLLISFALDYFFVSGDAPPLSVLDTIRRLAIMTAIPVALGILVRARWTVLADKITVYLRPVSLIVLISVIAFSLVVSIDLVLDNLLLSGPVAYLLNLCAMSAGYLLARYSLLNHQQVLTVTIEVGVQNATMATFLSLTILNSWEIAIAPTIYGCIMIFNSTLAARLLKR